MGVLRSAGESLTNSYAGGKGLLITDALRDKSKESFPWAFIFKCIRNKGCCVLYTALMECVCPASFLQLFSFLLWFWLLLPVKPLASPHSLTVGLQHIHVESITNLGGNYMDIASYIVIYASYTFPHFFLYCSTWKFAILISWKPLRSSREGLLGSPP